MSDDTKCDVAPETISAWVDEELEPAREREIRDHVRSCGGCRDRAERLRAVRRTVQSVPSPDAAPADDFVSEVRERIERNTGSDGEQARPKREDPADAPSGSTASTGVNRWMLSAAALLLVAAAGVFVVLTEKPSGRVAREEPAADRSTASRETPDGASDEATEERGDADENRKKASAGTDFSSTAADSSTEAGRTDRKSLPESSSAKDRTEEDRRTAREQRAPEQEGEEQLAEAKNGRDSKGGKQSWKEDADSDESSRKSAFSVADAGEKFRSEAEGKKKRKNAGSRRFLVTLSGNRRDIGRALSSVLNILNVSSVRYVRGEDGGVNEKKEADTPGKTSNKEEIRARQGAVFSKNLLPFGEDRHLRLDLKEKEARLLLAGLTRLGHRPSLRSVERRPDSSEAAAESPEKESSQEQDRAGDDESEKQGERRSASATPSSRATSGTASSSDSPEKSVRPPGDSPASLKSFNTRVQNAWRQVERYGDESQARNREQKRKKREEPVDLCREAPQLCRSLRESELWGRPGRSGADDDAKRADNPARRRRVLLKWCRTLEKHLRTGRNVEEEAGAFSGGAFGKVSDEVAEEKGEPSEKAAGTRDTKNTFRFYLHVLPEPPSDPDPEATIRENRSESDDR